ncbi:lactose-binding lectin l-2-like [Paramormyrops kingsleyae]|uniref:lactose-binding lectin l-2-like n=1 Tax=Paramormyrops kingsleyae TaxID=1676925 RepID=UPI003B979419
MAHTITVALLLCLLPLFGYGVEGQLRQQTASKLDTGFCKATCPPGWINFKNRCFKYIAVGKTWIDSELNCLSSGGNLASIHSEEEFQFIKALIKSRDSAENPTWIGLTDSSKEGTWLWTDGSKVDFTKWNSGEPNNVNGGENCVHTNWSGKGEKGWNDIACNSFYAFVCARHSGM